MRDSGSSSGNRYIGFKNAAATALQSHASIGGKADDMYSYVNSVLELVDGWVSYTIAASGANTMDVDIFNYSKVLIK